MSPAKKLKTISGQCPLVVTTNMILFRLSFRTKLSRIFFLCTVSVLTPTYYIMQYDAVGMQFLRRRQAVWF